MLKMFDSDISLCYR